MLILHHAEGSDTFKVWEPRQPHYVSVINSKRLEIPLSAGYGRSLVVGDG